MSADALTPVQQGLYDLLLGCSTSGEPCPRNVEIAERLGVTATNVSTALASLNTKGLIRTTRAAGERNIVIVVSGFIVGSPARMSHFGASVAAIGRVEVEPNYTQRDPCFLCGARGDFGCGCRR